MADSDGSAPYRLERIFNIRCITAGVAEVDREAMDAFLALLKKNDITRFHYEHCLRVGLLAADIGRFVYLPEKPLVIAGALHDIGKCEVPPLTLGKVSGWTRADMREVRRHVIAGWRLLRGRFDFAAEIVVRHHSFQSDVYPKRFPRWLHSYSQSTKLIILECARVVALADVYDALHRVNDKFGEPRALTSQEIRSKMFELNPDREALVRGLYNRGILE